MTRTAPSHSRSFALSPASGRRLAAAALTGCALIVGLPSASLADEAPAVATTTEDSAASMEARAEAARQLAAKRIAAKTAEAVDTIALSQTTAIQASLIEVESKSTKLSSTVTARVDAQLANAMTNFRVNAYAKAQANPSTVYHVANQN